MNTGIKNKHSQWMIISLMVMSLALGACGGGDSAAPAPVTPPASKPPADDTPPDNKPPVQGPIDDAPPLDLKPPRPDNAPPLQAFSPPEREDSFDAIVDEGDTRDDTRLTASLITIGEVQERSLWPAADVDWIKVELIADTAYEFSASKLCATCDTMMTLRNASGIELAGTEPGLRLDGAQDWINYDSNIQYTPTASGTFYIRMQNYSDNGVSYYELGARVLVDADGDGYSTYHDCDDANPLIFPYQIETAGNGDQDCSGTDWPLGTVVEGVSDNDTGTAVVMYETLGDPFEIIWRKDTYLANTRTIAPADDIDYFKVTVPAYSARYVEIVRLDAGLSLTGTLYDVEGLELYTTVLDPNSTDPAAYFPQINNPTEFEKIFYISFTGAGTDTGAYLPVLYSAGDDEDGDRHYSQDWERARDCDDYVFLVNPDEKEVRGDDTDSNCNGLDNS